MFKTFKRRVLSVLLIVVLVYFVLALVPSSQGIDGDNPFIVNDGLPVIIAHGGGNHEFPDNTLEAYYNAYHADKNVMLETDISLTKDGVLILSHDRTLDRKTTLQNAPIHEINYADLMADEIDFNYENTIEPRANGFNVSGELFPYKNYLGETVTPQDVVYPEGVEPRHETRFLATTLEELIKAFPDTKINVEIKQYGDLGLEALEKTIELLDRLDEDYNTYERIVLATFHTEIYNAFRHYQNTTHPQMMISPERSNVTKFFVFARSYLTVFFNEPIAVLQVPTGEGNINLATRNFLNAAHSQNIAVHYWTINDEATMRELIELGADGIMTDRPHKLREILNDYVE